MLRLGVLRRDRELSRCNKGVVTEEARSVPIPLNEAARAEQAFTAYFRKEVPSGDHSSGKTAPKPAIRFPFYAAAAVFIPLLTWLGFAEGRSTLKSYAEF